MLDIEKIISTIREDSNNLDFTGFVTNAQVEDASLRGEIWQHQRAEPCGRFADGHRIVTSRIIDVEARGNSVWFETENGSRYGILSFSPEGLINLSRLRNVDGFLAWPPIEKINHHSRVIGEAPRPFSDILTKRANRLKLNPKKGHPSRPGKNQRFTKLQRTSR